MKGPHGEGTVYYTTLLRFNGRQRKVLLSIPLKDCELVEYNFFTYLWDLSFHTTMINKLRTDIGLTAKLDSTG